MRKKAFFEMIFSKSVKVTALASKGFIIASSRIKKYLSDFSHLRGRNILIMLFAYYIINYNI